MDPNKFTHLNIQLLEVGTSDIQSVGSEVNKC
jgi:hypothetical protein